MKTQEIPIKTGTIRILMKPDAEVLEEVVVTGMQKMDKRLFTGATQQLTADNVKLDGLPDISRGLEGRAAGVSVQNVSGTFGTAPKIRVRGATSIYGSSKPLWVVDGVIMEDAIDVGPDVDVADLLGLDQVRKVSLPMDILPNQAIWIDQSMPMIGIASEEEYEVALAKRLQKLSEMEYPILVLFTSRKSMMAVSDLLDHREVRHLTQEKNGTAFNVKKRFDRGETNLLLGMGSFWEGVDFAQQDRVIEVIARLPFDNPKDPFYQKIESWFSKQGKSTFDLSLIHI
mgnify:CR=1 FL=1